MTVMIMMMTMMITDNVYDNDFDDNNNDDSISKTIIKCTDIDMQVEKATYLCSTTGLMSTAIYLYTSHPGHL